MNGRLLFLGTGSSAGIPLIGCQCEVCTSPSPFNKRLRPSALVSVNNKKFLIDAGPDFRQQALRYNITALDGVVFTHAHFDHTAGIDDLRIYFFWSKKPLPTLVSKDTAKEIKIRFDYLFKYSELYDNKTPRIVFHELPDELEGKIVFEEIPITYVTFEQGGMKVNGFRFNDLAYISDIRNYPETIFQYLKGIKTVVVSALRHQSSPLHFSVEEAVNFIEKTGAEKAWLTHVSHDLEHNKMNELLPPHIKMAYDGLEIDFGS